MQTFPSLQLLPSRSSSAFVLDLPVDRTQETLDLFLANQNSRGTRAVYKTELDIFFRSIGHKAIESVTSGDILSYKETLAALRPATISRKLTTIRAFFRFCLAEGIVDHDPTVNLRLPKVPDPRPKSLSLPELRSLFACIDRRTVLGKRDYAMFTLMLKGGLRRAEVRSLNHDDLEIRDGFLRIFIQNGKGAKSRHVDVDLSCMDAIRAYTDSMAIDPSGPVFLGEVRGFKKAPGRISLSSINARLKVYSQTSGVRCTVHSLRHSYATLCEQGGAHLEDLRESLGHSSLAVTQRYIKRLSDRRNPTMDFLPAL